MAGHELHWPGGHRSSAVLASTTALRGLKQGLKCPRCDSSNTKFCYYNNYSLSQPRHFCKTCRRYWTEGGALRDVPLGGGCRKNKKFRSLMGSSLHGIDLPPIIPRLTDHHQLASEPAVLFSPTDAAGFNCPPIDIAAVQACGSTVGGNAINPSSIELLSSINQDLHWNLQRQRLAVVFGEELTPNEAILPSAPERTPALAACGGSGSRDPQDSTAWPSECSHYAMLPSSAVASIRNTSSSDMSSTSYWNGEVQFLHGMTSPSPSSPHRCLRED